MKTTNSTILKVIDVLFWIAFIGLCLKTGVILFAFFASLFVNPEGAKDLYNGLDLADLHSLSEPYYIVTVSLLIVFTGLQAYIAYLVVKFFPNFKLTKPFSTELADLFLKISHVALGTSVLAVVAAGFCKWIMKSGIAIPIAWSGNEILFFSGVIYLLALVFKKGADLQTENDLTV